MSLQRALELAAAAKGRGYPKPTVGAVLVRDGEIVGRPGDVVSIPTWIFRGFTNSGDQDGWIFTALGGDDTGGIIWHPSILANAAQYGMFLTQDNMLVDTTAGTPAPAPDSLMQPL